MQTKLVLGSGHWNWGSEWLHIDANPDLNPDIVAVFPPLPDEVKRSKFSTIVASHIIEHVYLDEAKALLAECYSILETGGVLTLEQPDLGYCMRVALGDIEPPAGRDRVQFGLQGIFGLNWTGNRWDGHKFGYTPQSLAEILVEAGFSRDNITQKPARFHEPLRDFILEATK